MLKNEVPLFTEHHALNEIIGLQNIPLPQSTALPITTTTEAAQLDINTLLNMMIPLVLVVMIMSVMMGVVKE